MEIELSDKIKQAIASLRSTVNDHKEVGEKIMRAADGKLYPMDLFSFAVMNRSLCLMSGFCDLIEKHNFIAAAPLIRMQLDNLLRYRAAWLVKDLHDFAMEVFKGTKINTLKDKDGRKLKDGYLIESLAQEYPQLKNVYEHTSGYIHLSDKHFANALSKPNESEHTVVIKISSMDEAIPDSGYLEALMAFMEITGILFRYLKGWEVTKAGMPLKIKT